MPDLVALQTMLPQIDTPAQSQAKALQLRSLVQASQQADYQQQQQRQAAQDDASYRAALQANPTGGEGLLSSLASAGNYKGYATAQKTNLDNMKATSDIDKTKADAAKDKAETAGHQFEIAGQLVGSWANDPTINKQRVIAGLNAAAHSGVISPEIAQGKLNELGQIGDDPRTLQGWAQNTLMQVNKAKDQLALTQVDANTKANNAVSTANSQRTAASSKYAADSTAATASRRLAFDQTNQGDDTPMDPLAVRMTAQQYLAGDTSALQNFGRGAQGSRNLNAVRLEISKQANAQGMNGADIAAKVAEFGGTKAGQRTAGTRSAGIEIAAAEADQLAPLALQASQKVSRSSILPFGKAQIMFDSNTNDPDLRQFAMANTALANAYGQVMSRGGVASVSDKEHAKELLSTAFDQPSYAAAVQQLQQEIKAAQQAPGKVRANISAHVSGRDASAPAAGGNQVIDFGSLK